MTYQHQKMSNAIKQDLGVDYLEIEFILVDEEKSPKVDTKPNHETYELSAPISRKDMRKDRKSRRNSFVNFNRPVSNFSVAQSRISK